MEQHQHITSKSILNTRYIRFLDIEIDKLNSLAAEKDNEIQRLQGQIEDMKRQFIRVSKVKNSNKY